MLSTKEHRKWRTVSYLPFSQLTETRRYTIFHVTPTLFDGLIYKYIFWKVSYFFKPRMGRKNRTTACIRCSTVSIIRPLTFLFILVSAVFAEGNSSEIKLTIDFRSNFVH